MSVDVSKEELHINQIIGKKTDTILVEEDFVVPDIKPDILNVINTSGNVCVYKKEIFDGKVKIDGCINVYIIYIADNEKGETRSLNVSLNFSKIVEFEQAKSTMFLESNIILKQLECIIINGRKINVKGIIDLDFKLYSNEDIEYINKIERIKNIQLLNKDLGVFLLLGFTNTKLYAKDTLILDDIDNLMEIMKIDVKIKNEETKISYNKVLIKSDVEIKIMYLTQDNKIKSISKIIPTMGFIDMPNVSDENICNIKYEIKNLLVKPNSMEEHSIYAEVELEAMCIAYENKKLNLIQDLYSPSVNLSYKQNKVKFISNMINLKQSYNIREKKFIEEMQNVEICDTKVNINIKNMNIEQNKIIYECEANIKFLFNKNGLNKKEIVVPFNFPVDVANISENSKVDTKIKVINEEFIIMPDSNIDIKIDIELMLNSINTINANVINELNVEENRNDNIYSVIIYFVKEGDTLWDIAKKFKSTINDIVKINELEDENKIYVGNQLLIPFVNY